MFIDAHTHQKSQSKTNISCVNVSIENIRDNIKLPDYFSVGIHPWQANPYNIEDLNIIKKLSANPAFIAIGECGLDKVNGPDFTTQLDIFTTQIQLSEDLCKPLIIHCVKAYSEIIKLRKDIKPKQPWVIHGFNASIQTMQQALKHGFYFSFGMALINNQPKAINSLKVVPLDKILLETDDEKNISIEIIYEKTSKLLNMNITKIQRVIKNNFKYIFNV